MKKIIPFTKKPPSCPKCGSKSVKRFYATAMTDLDLSRSFDLNSHEFLKLVCQTCDYEWAQEAKDAKRMYPQGERGERGEQGISLRKPKTGST